MLSTADFPSYTEEQLRECERMMVAADVPPGDHERYFREQYERWEDDPGAMAYLRVWDDHYRKHRMNGYAP